MDYIYNKREYSEIDKQLDVYSSRQLSESTWENSFLGKLDESCIMYANSLNENSTDYNKYTNRLYHVDYGSYHSDQRTVLYHKRKSHF